MGPGEEQRQQESNPVARNIDAIVELHLAGERNVSRHQRALEKVTHFIGKPWLFYVAVAFSAFWIAANVTGQRWDPPPFPLLQLIATIAALIVAIVVLITQTRQAKVDRRQAQLDLQISLAIDQRAAKIIDLLEEMRRDSPHLRNRIDPEVEELRARMDPIEVVEVLETKLESAIEELVEARHTEEFKTSEDRDPGVERNI